VIVEGISSEELYVVSIDACLSGDVTRSFRLHDINYSEFDSE